MFQSHHTFTENVLSVLQTVIQLRSVLTTYLFTNVYIQTVSWAMAPNYLTKIFRLKSHCVGWEILSQSTVLCLRRMPQFSPKMHQNKFGARAPPTSLGECTAVPEPFSCIRSEGRQRGSGVDRDKGKKWAVGKGKQKERETEIDPSKQFLDPFLERSLVGRRQAADAS